MNFEARARRITQIMADVQKRAGGRRGGGAPPPPQGPQGRKFTLRKKKLRRCNVCRQRTCVRKGLCLNNLCVFA